MTALSQAKALDQADRAADALKFYEEAIANGEGDLNEYIDLAFLYFQCTDFGYAAAQRLPPSFESTAYERAIQVLNLAEERFGAVEEIEFWRLFFAWSFGEEDFYERAERILDSGTAVPAMYLLSGPRGRLYLSQAEALYDLVRDGSTAKERYMTHFIETHRRKWL